MDVRRAAIFGAVAVIAVAGGGVALATISGDDAKKAEDSILDRAAKKLGVEPGELRGALGEAEDAQLDEAVKNGDLTAKQAEAMKAHRRRSGRVLGHLGRPHRGFGPGRRGGFRRGARRGGPLKALASALGISRDKLIGQFRDGKSVAQIARAEGKSLSDVKASLKASAKRRLDAAVKREDLTRKQADRMLEGIDRHLARLGEFRGFRHGPGRGHGRRRGHDAPGGPAGPGPAGPPPGVTP